MNISSPILDLQQGSYKYQDHFFNASYLQSSHSTCQPSQAGTYQWGFSFPLLFAFMVVTTLLALSVLLTWYKYYDRCWPQQVDMMFGRIRTALVVSTSVRETLGDTADAISGEQLDECLLSSSDGVKREHAKSQIMEVPAPHGRRHARLKKELPVGSEAYKLYIANGRIDDA
jgi:hypothetical protein